MPNEVLLEILSYLDVCDLLSTSRVSQTLDSAMRSPRQYATLRIAAFVLPTNLSPMSVNFMDGLVTSVRKIPLPPDGRSYAVEWSCLSLHVLSEDTTALHTSPFSFLLGIIAQAMAPDTFFFSPSGLV